MKPVTKDAVTVVLFALTGLYPALVLPVFLFVDFGMGFVGDQTNDPRIDLLKSLAIVGTPGLIVAGMWWIFFRSTKRSQP
jgi:hypothetical protein